MCNRYSMVSNQAAILGAAGAVVDHTGNLAPMPDVFPDYPAPIIRNGRGPRTRPGALQNTVAGLTLKRRATDSNATNIRS